MTISKNITQFLETQFPLGQVGFLLCYFAFSLAFEEQGLVQLASRGLLWEKSRGRSPNVTSNPFFDFFPFRVGLSSCKYP